jgi:hypothetical protein
VTSLVDSDTFAFADGNAGHLCDFGSSPTVDQLDVLCVNSNTVVSTPAGGWTPAEVVVTNQGAYIFTRFAVGGEASTVTITTSGNHNCQVSWSRWNGLLALDTSTNTEVNAATGGATPAHSTGVLAEVNELVVAFGALHSIQGANQSAPVWSTGYTGLTAVTQGSSTDGVIGYVGYRTDAGTAAETPQVSWSSDGAFNRYMLAVSFTAAAGGQEIPIGLVVTTVTTLAMTATKSRTLGLLSALTTVFPLTGSKSRTLGLVTTTATILTLTGDDEQVVTRPLATHVAGPQQVTHVTGPQRAVHVR